MPEKPSSITWEGIQLKSSSTKMASPNSLYTADRFLFGWKNRQEFCNNTSGVSKKPRRCVQTSGVCQKTPEVWVEKPPRFLKKPRRFWCLSHGSDFTLR